MRLVDKNYNYKRDIYYLIIGILYRIVIDVSYYFVLQQWTKYTPFSFSLSKYILSWILYIILFVAIHKKEKSISSFLLNLQFVIMITPMFTFFAMHNQSTFYMILVFIAMLIEVIIVQSGMKKECVKIRVRGVSNYVTVFMGIFIVAVTISIILYCPFYGLKMFNLEFMDLVRENREAFPAPLSYFITWLYSVIIPFYIVYSAEQKKYMITILLGILDGFLFLLLGYKTIILSVFFVLAMYVLAKCKNTIRQMYVGIGIMMLALTLIGIIGPYISDKWIYIDGILGNRFIFEPAKNKFYYYECFSEYPLNYFANGIIGKCLGIASVLSDSVPHVVNMWITKASWISYNNTGYLGEGYAQLGWFGVILFSVLVAIVIRFVEKINLDPAIVIATMGYIIIIILNDGAFLTTFLTNGLWLLLAFYLVYSKDCDNEKERGKL